MTTDARFANPALIIDVRRPFEYEVRHIEGAVNLSWELTNFDAEVADLARAAFYITHCNYGGRGCQAAERMRQLGFKHVIGLGIEEVATLTGRAIV